MFGKRSKMVDGILLIDKEKGFTSYDVIRRLKPKFEKKQKIGHAGSLDPFATGLLIVMLGKSTKFFDKFQELPKEYKVIGEFGYETDTYDITGQKVFEDKDFKKKVDEEKIREVLKNFRGEILQTPPAFSAKKVDGRRAYDLAREKKDVKLEAKRVNIYELELLNFDGKKVELYVKCSKGTYVRSLIVDIARSLGTYATCIELRREKIGDFDVKNAVKVDQVDLSSDILKSFL
jgi:tRNA pseudouridine55 synthase